MKKIIVSFIVFVAVGCSDSFFDINENPNSATESNMTPNLVLPAALNRVGDMTATSYSIYNRWLGYWARSGTYGPNTEEESYKVTPASLQGSFLSWYDILKDFDVIEKKALERNETAYIAVAKIMKTIGFMSLVDQYNNVPYSKAFDLKNHLLTPYDDAQEVYNDLVLQLEEAEKLLRDTKLDDNFRFESADIIFQGDLDKWRKLANTQRLRLIIHQSKLLGNAGMKTEIAKITSNGAGFLGAGESASVQPGYVKDNGKQNPYWNAYKKNYAGDVSDNFNRANNYFLNLLRSNQDIRYKYLYSKATKPLDGEEYYGFTYGKLNAPGEKQAANSSDVAGPGIAKGPDMPQWILPSFESLFLQAEAIQRGVLSGDAKSKYEEAVEESFVWLGVEEGGKSADEVAKEYLNSTVVDFAKWDATTDKIKLILTQKYIAMFGINGLEVWSQYRRTGIPNVPLSVSPLRGSNHIPLRAPYPLQEYQYNAENVLKQGDIDPQTSKIFWDK